MRVGEYNLFPLFKLVANLLRWVWNRNCATHSGEFLFSMTGKVVAGGADGGSLDEFVGEPCFRS